MSYNFIDGKRIGDWVVYCHICGCKAWASDTQKLSNETGRGGLRVCPDCVDVIDYGIVPYKIPAEKSVPFVSYLLPTPTDPFPSFDYQAFDPLTTTPQELVNGQPLPPGTITIDMDTHVINLDSNIISG